MLIGTVLAAFDASEPPCSGGGAKAHETAASPTLSQFLAPSDSTAM